jgi:hypothetical protein
MKAKNLHITGLYMMRRFAAWLPKIRSRRKRLCAYFLQHILRLLVFAAQSPYTQPQNVI